MPAAQGSVASSYALYASSIFTSAFLLFFVQPLVGKHLLPAFGGSSSVWATSLLFFTGLLFVGYVYVYALSKRSPRVQVLVHTLVASVSLAWVGVSFALHRSLMPPLEWTLGSGTSASLLVLAALGAAIGAPYFLLATTSPLLQYWYARTAQREPYTLYAISNAGSLLALASYPLAAEPLLPLTSQGMLWSALFAACVAAIIYIARHTRFSAPASEGRGSAQETYGLRRRAVWVSYAALPALLLVATSTEITQVIAPIPLLWIAPLALYLLTFILAFAGYGQGRLPPLALWLAALWVFSLQFLGMSHSVETLSYLALLFIACLVCHARLYALRPSGIESPIFYLHLSFGGMLGALLGSIIAPALFPDFWELPFAVAFSAGVAAALLLGHIVPKSGVRARRVAFTAGVAALSTGVLVAFFVVDASGRVHTSRNFYGVATVRDYGDMRVLSHGSTRHGAQFMDPERRDLPITYYAPSSGIGRALAFAKSARGEGALSVGVIGLGTGTLAAYCRERDEYVFYEIDRRMTRIAQEYFSYLSLCDGAEVRHGDGRMLLSAELRSPERSRYDVLAVDAFSDDAIPVHLLTLEALALYAEHLRDDTSILAIHVSNQYLTLSPVVTRLATALGFSSMIIRDWDAPYEGSTVSEWVLLARSPEVFRALPFAHSDSYPSSAHAPLWTDDYASILPTLYLPSFALW